MYDLVGRRLWSAVCLLSALCLLAGCGAQQVSSEQPVVESVAVSCVDPVAYFETQMASRGLITKPMPSRSGTRETARAAAAPTDFRGPEIPTALGEPAEPQTDTIVSRSEQSVGAANHDERELLARMISAEASQEPYDGMVAVGAVIINRMKAAEFPDTLDAVLFDPGQFCPVGNGWFWQTVVTDEHRNAAQDALSGIDPTGGALYFFAYKKSSNSWLWSRPVLTIIGDHRFTA